MRDVEDEQKKDGRWWNPLRWGFGFWWRPLGFVLVLLPTYGWKAFSFGWNDPALWLVNGGSVVLMLGIGLYVVARRRRK